MKNMYSLPKVSKGAFILYSCLLVVFIILWWILFIAAKLNATPEGLDNSIGLLVCFYYIWYFIILLGRLKTLHKSLWYSLLFLSPFPMPLIQLVLIVYLAIAEK